MINAKIYQIYFYEFLKLRNHLLLYYTGCFYIESLLFSRIRSRRGSRGPSVDQGSSLKRSRSVRVCRGCALPAPVHGPEPPTPSPGPGAVGWGAQDWGLGRGPGAGKPGGRGRGRGLGAAGWGLGTGG